MFKKKQRLNGKEIAYILRKGKTVYGKFLIFRVIPQWRNVSYRQASIQIPVKLDKRAAKRNLLKRDALVLFEKYAQRYYTKNANLFFKVFVFVNKKSLSPLKEILEKKKTRLVSDKKTNILDLWHSGCSSDFTLFFRHLGRLLSTNSKMWGNKQKSGGKNGQQRPQQVQRLKK